MTANVPALRPPRLGLLPPQPGPHPVPALAFSARRPLLLGFLTLTVLGGGAFGWGAFASLVGAVIAFGQVEVESRDQVVEHLDGGTVGAILTKDGDHVEAGQVLVRLSGEELQSEAALLEAELAELIARRNRLEAEFGDADAITWDATLVVRAENNPAVAAVLEGPAPAVPGPPRFAGGPGRAVARAHRSDEEADRRSRGAARCGEAPVRVPRPRAHGPAQAVRSRTGRAPWAAGAGA